MFHAFLRPQLLRNSLKAVPVLFGTFALRPRAFIHNDVAAVPQQRFSSPVQSKVRTSRLNGKLDYGDLCIGSFTGLFLGIIVGKLSTAIVFLSLSSYLLLQFLENRGIITIPWNSVLSVGKERIDLKSLLFNKPSFKVAFSLTFLLAALNV